MDTDYNRKWRDRAELAKAEQVAKLSAISSLDDEAAEIMEMLSEVSPAKGKSSQAHNKRSSQHINAAIYIDEPAEAGTEWSSLAKGLTVFSLCILIAIGGLIYGHQERLVKSVSAQTLYNNQQQLPSTNYELVDLVRKAPAKLPGSTIGQALTSYLNIKKGRDWQPVSWKAEDEAGKKDSSIVKFLWTEHGTNKEAIWQVDVTTRAVRAVNEEAARIGP